MNNEDMRRKAIIQNKWNVIRVFCQNSHRQALVPGGVFINETPPDEFYNLPFILAYEILEDVLKDFEEDEMFSLPLDSNGKKKKGLYYLLESSKISPSLKWIDYKTVFRGKENRDNLAHKGILLKKDECLLYINAIEKELKKWSLID